MCCLGYIVTVAYVSQWLQRAPSLMYLYFSTVCILELWIGSRDMSHNCGCITELSRGKFEVISRKNEDHFLVFSFSSPGPEPKSCSGKTNNVFIDPCSESRQRMKSSNREDYVELHLHRPHTSSCCCNNVVSIVSC